ncbi:MAG: Ig-like domain-containing protein [Paramuribaculum sp.]|nr:Ig-like domain-containing protein [Paramuribaculum sp.]
MRLLVGVVAGLLLVACANMGRPEGGPRDETPPVFLRSNPGQGALNVTSPRVNLYFDENIALDDAMSKVVVSPAQITPPSVSANGHRITVELRDSLKPNTTYTIDFSDAIKDLNEGNVLDGFATDFSTGDYIDTLQISGMVFQAENLEPAQGMLVGVYSNLSDTALTTLSMERITKTNQLGQFTLRNLKEGTYRIFAINDVNRDYKWDRSENVAFYDLTVTPEATPATYNDTLVAVDGTDSIVEKAMTRYLPDDILLTWFNENYKAQYLTKYERSVRNKLYFEFADHSDTLPEIRIINGPRAGESIDRWAVLNGSATRDTLEYWIRDSLIINMDSVLIEARYLRTDSLDLLSWTTDTLKMFMKAPKKSRKNKDKEEEKPVAEADTLATDSVAELPIEFFKLSSRLGGTIDMTQSIVIETAEPIDRFDPNAVHLDYMEDSVWIEIERPQLAFPIPTRPMILRGEYEWTPGARYRLRVDSASVYGMYGTWNAPLSMEFAVKKAEEYSSLTLDISGLDGRSAVAQMLNSSDAVIRTAPVVNSRVTFPYVNPGTYYARLFIDGNDNGRWDTGNVADSIQPEEVYYYPKKLVLRQNWDVEQSWNITELPVDQQKPEDIKKNRPKPKKGQKTTNRTDEDDEDEDDYFMPGNSRNNGNNRLNNSGNRNLPYSQGSGRFSTMSRY